jgi:DNA-binding NtrC family response regulator
MRLKSELHEAHTSEIIGQAAPIRRAIELALNVADTNTTVLIQGESGTGKELLANLIHYNSGRENKAVYQIKLRRDSRKLCSKASFSDTKKARLPTRELSARTF